MTMKPTLYATVALLFATVAQAQIYQWQDENRKTVLSDRPPANSARPAKKTEAEPPSTAAEGGKSLADREMEFRKRQKESRENAEKAEKEQRIATQKQEECERIRRSLSSLESGERQTMRDEKGERYIMDDTQRAQESARLRQMLQTHCP